MDGKGGQDARGAGRRARLARARALPRARARPRCWPATAGARAALFLSKSGRRLSTSDVRRRLRALDAPRRAAGGRLAAHAAPLVRDPPARRGRRSALDPGAARPRDDQHDPDIHSGRVGAPQEGVRARPPDGPERRRRPDWRPTSRRSSSRTCGAATRTRRPAGARAARARLLAARQVRGRPHVERPARARRGVRPHLLRAARPDLGDRALRARARDQVRDVRDHAHQGLDHRRAALARLGAALGARHGARDREGERASSSTSCTARRPTRRWPRRSACRSRSSRTR